MMTFISSTFYFLVAIAVLVTFHEYGHFSAARLLGIKVLRFSVGFGKVLWRYTDKRGTEYCLSAMPFGGYVKMLDEFEGKVSVEELPQAFNRQPIWKRSLVVFAGPLFNILFAFIAYSCVFMLGISRIMPVVGHVQEGSIAAEAGIRHQQQFVSVNHQPTIGWQEVNEALVEAYHKHKQVDVLMKDFNSQSTVKTTLDLSRLSEVHQSFIVGAIGIRPILPTIPNHVERIIEGSPAARAGIKSGDNILKINGEVVKSWNDMIRYIRVHPEVESYQLLLGRGDERIELTITPEKRTMPNGDVIPMMGIQSSTAHYQADMLTTEHYLPWNALQPAFERTAELTWLTVKLLAKLLTGQVSLHAVTGPVGIAVTAGKAAESGLVEFLHFLAMISISLAVINLVPLPVLDGGHLLFYLIEAVIRRPLSVKAQRVAIEFGMYLIIGLMVVVSINDIIVKALH